MPTPYAGPAMTIDNMRALGLRQKATLPTVNLWSLEPAAVYAVGRKSRDAGLILRLELSADKPQLAHIKANAPS